VLAVEVDFESLPVTEPGAVATILSNPKSRLPLRQSTAIPRQFAGFCRAFSKEAKSGSSFGFVRLQHRSIIGEPNPCKQGFFQITAWQFSDKKSASSVNYFSTRL
jgi:hypothetical protein